jgi:hypothetical protein
MIKAGFTLDIIAAYVVVMHTVPVSIKPGSEPGLFLETQKMKAFKSKGEIFSTPAF